MKNLKTNLELSRIEKWLPIEGFEMYSISNIGRIRNTKRKKLLSPNVNNTGSYPIVCLRKDGKTISKKIHQLVAIAFLNHEPCGNKLVIDHINGDRQDNRLSNLRIVTQSENLRGHRKDKNLTDLEILERKLKRVENKKKRLEKQYEDFLYNESINSVGMIQIYFKIGDLDEKMIEILDEIRWEKVNIEKRKR